MTPRKQQFKSFEVSSGRNIVSDYEFLLLVMNAFTAGTEEYYPKSYNVNDT